MKKIRIKEGDRIDAYHDGKCHESRRVTVIVEDVVPRDLMTKKCLRMWKRAINKDFKDSLLDGFIHYIGGPQQFWDWNCDEFVFGHIEGDKESEKDTMMFAKRPSGGWYGVNWNYFLDVGNTVRKEAVRHAAWKDTRRLWRGEEKK